MSDKFLIMTGILKKAYFSAFTKWISRPEKCFRQERILRRGQVNGMCMKLITRPIKSNENIKWTPLVGKRKSCSVDMPCKSFVNFFQCVCWGGVKYVCVPLSFFFFFFCFESGMWYLIKLILDHCLFFILG